MAVIEIATLVFVGSVLASIGKKTEEVRYDTHSMNRLRSEIRALKDDVADKDAHKVELRLNRLFKVVGLKNSESKYAKVTTFKEDKNLYTCTVQLPMGTDDDQLRELRGKISTAFGTVTRIGTAYHVETGVKIYEVTIYKDNLKKSYKYKEVKMPDYDHLWLNLGMTLDGEALINLSKDGIHAIIAGATGSGKTTLMQVIIAQALQYPNHLLRIWYLDNKEGSGNIGMDKISQIEVLTESAQQSAEAIKKILPLHKERMEIIKNAGCKDILQYNKRCKNELDKLPFIMVMVDELMSFNELGKTAKEELYEEHLSVIGSKARASGIHLILATQRPTSDVLPRTVGTHFGVKIGLKTRDRHESMNIIEEYGLEKINKDYKGRGVYLIDEHIDFQTWYMSDEEYEAILEKHSTKVKEQEVNKDKLEKYIKYTEKTIMNTTKELIVNGQDEIKKIEKPELKLIDNAEKKVKTRERNRRKVKVDSDNMDSF